MENGVNAAATIVAERGNLEFRETLTVEQFKKAVGVDIIHVKRNPHTGKLFFTYGGKTGAVAAKGIPSKPMISIVSDGQTSFPLLHEEANGAPDIATF